MKKSAALSIVLCLVLVLTSCSSVSLATTQAIPVVTKNAAVSPSFTISPIIAQSDRQVWRYYTSIPVQLNPETTVQQGDCKTTYNSLKVLGIKDGEFKTWLESEIQAFTDGILKDESSLKKTKQEFTDKGLDKLYPGSTFIRRVFFQAYSTGGIFCLEASDYTVYRPTDAQIKEHKLGWEDGRGAFQYYFEDGIFTTYDNEGIMSFAEAYTYQYKTKCLNLIQRKPIQLGDIIRGEDSLKQLNLALSRSITDLDLIDDEVLKRPFTGIEADYPYFTFQCYEPGSGYLRFYFNDGNAWFNMEAPDDWCTYRQIAVDLSEYGALLNPVWYDDSLVSVIDASLVPDGYWMGMGRKYLPNLGLAQYEVSNAETTVRISNMDDSTVKEKINAGIAAFEAEYLNEAYVKDNLFFPEAQKDNKGLAIRTMIREMGSILEITYFLNFNMRETSLSLLFDLSTGNRVTYRDLLKKEYYGSADFKNMQSKIKEDFNGMDAYGQVYLYYEPNVTKSDRQWAPRYTEQQVSSDYFDWEKWGSIKK